MNASTLHPIAPQRLSRESVGSRASRGQKHVIGRFALYLVLILLSVTFAIPFLWLVTTSLKQTGQELRYPPQWLPDPVVWSNYVEVFRLVPLGRWFVNTVIIVVLNVIGGTLSATMAGYAFARLRFPGRGPLFTVCLATLMLPHIVVLIPQFILFRNLGWVGTNLPLWVPAFFGGTGFLVFLSRQFFMTIPYDLDEAGRIDGADSFQIWWSILVPLCGPLLATMAILQFQSHWNEFLAPLIYLPDAINWTLSVGLRGMLGEYWTRWNLLTAAAALMTVPIIVAFFAAQRHFIRGIVTSGISGR